MLFINLAISDLGVLIIRHSFDSIQLYLKGNWLFGEIGCKVIPPISRTFHTVSIVTLVAVSYQRYNAIVRVLRKEESVKRSSIMIFLMWSTILSSYGALIMPFRKLDINGRCVDSLSRVKYIASVVVEKGFYVFCFICVFYMFGEMKKSLLNSLKVQQNSNIQRRIPHGSVKTLKLLKPTVFFMCITLCPAWALLICVLHVELSVDSRYIFYHIIGLLLVINSAANPFIYALASRSFHKSFTKMLCKCFDSSNKQNTNGAHKLNRRADVKNQEPLELSMKKLWRLNLISRLCCFCRLCKFLSDILLSVYFIYNQKTSISWKFNYLPPSITICLSIRWGESLKIIPTFCVHCTLQYMNVKFSSNYYLSQLKLQLEMQVYIKIHDLVV